MKRDSSKLTRDTHTMPGFVKQALDESGLTTTYEERPAYQQNDYTGRINRAKRQETKRKRLQQMLYELEVGGVYMGMNHPASADYIPDSPRYYGFYTYTLFKPAKAIKKG